MQSIVKSAAFSLCLTEPTYMYVQTMLKTHRKQKIIFKKNVNTDVK